MATLELQKPLHERIKIVQKQLRIAIQNHQLLVVKNKVNPSDPDVKKHINLMQGLIISMGRAQSDLLTGFRNEIKSSDTKQSEKYLMWPEVPKHIPIFGNQLQEVQVKEEEDAELSSDGKKIANWKSKKDLKKTRKSLLKVNTTSVKRSRVVKGKLESRKEGSPTQERILLGNNSEIKIVYSKKGEDSLLKHTKKLQSVLKTKSPDKAEEKKIDMNNGLPANIGLDSKRNSSDGVSDDTECAELIPIINPLPPESLPKPVVKKQLQPDLLVKTKLRLRTRSSSFLRKDAKFDCDKSNRDGTVSPPKNELSGSPSPPRIGISEDLNPNWVSIDDIGQDGFLRYFGLINQEKCAAIKKKKCERKRRSVAGQSSYYNDYLQPMTPKRTYGPRKSVPPLVNSQVVVETAIEVEDEEDKPRQNCTICQKNGNLEVCHMCSESYHMKCVPNGGSCCPSCHAQRSNIKNIVGANSASSASSMELIKRYLSSGQEKNAVEKKIEGTLQWSVVITARPKP